MPAGGGSSSRRKPVNTLLSARRLGRASRRSVWGCILPLSGSGKAGDFVSLKQHIKGDGIALAAYPIAFLLEERKSPPLDWGWVKASAEGKNLLCQREEAAIKKKYGGSYQKTIAQIRVLQNSDTQAGRQHSPHKGRHAKSVIDRSSIPF